MDVIIGPLLQIILVIIDIYVWIVVAGVILSWLTAYRVVNTSNSFVYMIGDFIHRVTEPALRPIRNILPVMGGFDLSPVALILGLMFLQGVLVKLLIKFGV
ncbi:MAG: YggT family protein [Planctomycetes bacterium]|nr:YggT family protein [Planctomycetota bacterium]